MYIELGDVLVMAYTVYFVFQYGHLKGLYCRANRKSQEHNILLTIVK